ncbi:carbohydrate-binding protein [Chitinophaga sp. YIM B06452]|uniref:carbohydrate-binding protein n=1 Tax=Chitinophaga sp. YIM B06452 TaxID=3082158 RepID=UPI0031FE4D61
MKTTSFSKILLAACVTLSAAGCAEKSEYRNMQPVREVKSNTYDFIKSANHGGLYDSLLYILDKTGLAEKLKTGKTTFFVPQDFSINAAMYNLNFTREKRGDPGNWTIDSVSTGIWDTLLTRYMINGEYNLDSLRFADGVNLVTPYGYEMNGKAITTTASGIEAGGSMVIQYSDKNNSRIIKNWVMTTTEAANLKTSTGMVHMLEPKHIFGFSSFVDKVYPPRMTPFLGKPISIPGHIEIGYFDIGGQGVAYYDVDPAVNKGAPDFRKAEGVDIDVCSDGGLYNIGATNPNEWLKYTVKVEHTGMYAVFAKVASPNSDGVFHIEKDGVDITGPLKSPKTGNYQSWTVVKANDVLLTEGTYVFTYYEESGGFNGGRFGFLPRFRVPYNGQPVNVPGTVMATEFDYGDNMCNDADAYNKGSARHLHRVFEGTDTEATNEAPGSYHISHVAVGEWAVYSINVTKAGNYRIQARVASTNATGRMHLEIDGVNVSGEMATLNTGSYQTFTNVSSPVIHLTEGQHDFKFVAEKTGFNLSKFIFVAL